ncbi:MAG: hypothetical protein JEZ04_21625 [Spirochaetales bacterium]|nr:hypothetical protein [Spirochaetales bacterium]
MFGPCPKHDVKNSFYPHITGFRIKHCSISSLQKMHGFTPFKYIIGSALTGISKSNVTKILASEVTFKIYLRSKNYENVTAEKK